MNQPYGNQFVDIVLPITPEGECLLSVVPSELIDVTF